MKAFFIFSTLALFPILSPLTLKAETTHPFFGNKKQAILGTYATGLTRSLLVFFRHETFEGTQYNSLYTVSYCIPGHLGSLSLRHRFETGYQGNTQSAYKHYRIGLLGWMPELMLNLDPCYITLGVGPYWQTRTTPMNGGHFVTNSNLVFGIAVEDLRFEFFLRHHSNAYTSKPNHGCDFIGLSLGYVF